jgi:hypothetical protein
MPIKVQCACGKAFAAKDELAGKTVKCPACQQPLKISAGPTPASKAAAKPATASAKKSPASKPAGAKVAAPAPAPAKPSDSLFDELGLAPPLEGTRPCPGCTAPLAIEAVICVKCGYNSRIGRRMTTEKASGGEGAGGHGAVAQDLLDRAASVMEGDAEAEKKKTTEGLPWWVYLIVLIIFIGLATWMLNRGGDEKTDENKKGFLPTTRGPLV